MTDVFKFRENQPVVWFHRDRARGNQHCPYCGALVGHGSTIPSDKEHLIGRKFVPAGSLDQGTAFNFIFRACVACNTRKADLERHISSVTLFDSPARKDPHVNAIALNKAEKDFHPTKKGVPVKDAFETTRIDSHSGNLEFGAELVGPPQIASGAIEELAFRQIQGFFSLCTSKNPTITAETKLLPDKYFLFHRAYRHSDWGNPELKDFSKRTEHWVCPLVAVTAGGFFRALMKRDRDPDGGWFWALEWNKALRVVGGIGSRESPPKIFENLPDLKWSEFRSADGRVLRYRLEKAKECEEPDYLFGS